MRWPSVVILVIFSTSVIVEAASAQARQPDTSAPTTLTMADLRAMKSMEGELVAMTALVHHTDTAQVFTFGEKEGAEVHVVIPNPAVDAANVGDTVAITGFVRVFSASDFERDYKWFRCSDYPHLNGGDWVIVATSVRTPEGTEMVPPGAISNTPPVGKEH